MNKTILVVSGPDHSRKKDLLWDLMDHLEKQTGAKPALLRPDAPDSSVILESKQMRVGIIRAGQDPREPVDHLYELEQRQCGLIIYLLSDKHKVDELETRAMIGRYSIIHWTPLRVGRPPTWLLEEDDPSSKSWASRYNKRTLIELVDTLTRSSPSS